MNEKHVVRDRLRDVQTDLENMDTDLIFQYSEENGVENSFSVNYIGGTVPSPVMRTIDIESTTLSYIRPERSVNIRFRISYK